MMKMLLMTLLTAIASCGCVSEDPTIDTSAEQLQIAARTPGTYRAKLSAINRVDATYTLVWKVMVSEEMTEGDRQQIVRSCEDSNYFIGDHCLAAHGRPGNVSITPSEPTVEISGNVMTVHCVGRFDGSANAGDRVTIVPRVKHLVSGRTLLIENGDTDGVQIK